MVRPQAALSSVKVVVSGGFGVGKTTFIDTISEIGPLCPDALTEVAIQIDDASFLPGQLSTTVELDFGRITLDPSLVLYLFGTPGQTQFNSVWDDLSRGAIGAVVIADIRRIEDSVGCVEYFQRRGMPFLLAVNRFDGCARSNVDEVRRAVGVGPEVPVVDCDARDRDSVKQALLVLLDRVLLTHGAYRRVRQVAR